MTGHRIVVADDDSHVLATLSQLVELAGHTVVGKASTGEEAIWLNQSLSPDVVILDLQMPGMSGIDAATRMMATHPVAIVVCTAYFDTEVINSAINAGAYAYLVKPCRMADLAPAINVAVSRFEESKLLKGEVNTLKDDLDSRKYIEQAKGIVMKTRQLSEDDAHRFLQAESQRQSKPISELAKAIILAQKAFSPTIYGNTRT